MAYASLAQLKTYLGISSNADDALLSELLERASAAIDSYTARRFAPFEETRQYDDGVYGKLLVLDDDVVTLIRVLNGDGVDITGAVRIYRTRGRTVGLLHPAGWNVSAGPILVTAVWGLAETPRDIIHACVRLAAYYYRQRDAQVFDVTALPDQGALLVPHGIPADVKQILNRYRMIR